MFPSMLLAMAGSCHPAEMHIVHSVWLESHLASVHSGRCSMNTAFSWGQVGQCWTSGTEPTVGLLVFHLAHCLHGLQEYVWKVPV